LKSFPVSHIELQNSLNAPSNYTIYICTFVTYCI